MTKAYENTIPRRRFCSKQSNCYLVYKTVDVSSVNSTNGAEKKVIVLHEETILYAAVQNRITRGIRC